jgi:branched-chain amino acid transport system substrate-binding protein
LKDTKRFGTIYYNLGVENGILNVEAVRTAQAKFGNRPLTGEEVRWGFENLNIDDARAVRFQQWDGGKWVVISDWVHPDRSVLRPIIESSAARYAKEKGIKPRNCAQETHASR